MSNSFCDSIAVKPLFDGMSGRGSVPETSVICCVCLPCRCVCFCCVYLSVLLVVFLCHPNAPPKSVAIKTEANCGLSLPLSGRFFAGIHGAYSHMTWPSSLGATTSFSTLIFNGSTRVDLVSTVETASGCLKYNNDDLLNICVTSVKLKTRVICTKDASSNFRR